MKHLFFLMVAFLVGCDFTRAENPVATNNVPASADQMSLAPLVAFVLKEGEAGSAETYIVKNLGLGNNDVAIIQKGWKSHADNLNHLVAVSTQNKDDVLIFLFNQQISGVCWLTSKSGQIRSTVEFDRGPHISHVTPNALHLQDFEQQKKYLLKFIAARNRKS